MTACTQFDAMPGENGFDYGSSPPGRIARKVRSAVTDRGFDLTMPYALTAIQQISALQVPADPPSFHLWYAYATRAFPELNQTINEMLERIDTEHGSADTFVARSKDKNDTTRLMGFGHRVYKSYDPRAAILKRTCEELRTRLGSGGRLLDIAFRLEEIALKDEYFVSRNLYPNVDFYSGIIYRALGFREHFERPYHLLDLDD
jgi:hypothetical protein